MNQNIKMIDEVSILLNEFAEKVVFVGGAITSLLITDPALSNIRPTIDVDVIMSHDIEDIITVIDGREELATEIKKAPIKLRQ